MRGVISEFQSFSRTARRIDRTATEARLVIALCDIREVTMAQHVRLVVRHVPGLTTDAAFDLDTAGGLWTRFGLDRGHAAHDPAATLGTEAAIPVDWSIAAAQNPRIKRLSDELATAHIGNCFITGAHRGASGDFSLLTLSSKERTARWPTRRDVFITAMGVLHPVLHRTALRLVFGFSGHSAVKLSARERECLLFAAQGRTSREIGANLGLTPATVNYFIDAAADKLSADSRVHAAAKAVALGLIPPPL